MDPFASQPGEPRVEAPDVLSSSDPDSSSLYQRVAYQLNRAGYQTRLDAEQQLVVFTHEQGDDIVIICDDEPSMLLRVFCHWSTDPSLDRDELKRLRAATLASEECKLAKVFLNEDTLVVCVDHLVFPATDLQDLIEVCVSAIYFAAARWHEAMGVTIVDEQGNIAG